MSLINNALKKAQRQRDGNTASAYTTSGSSGGPLVRRGSAMPAQTLILLIAGAATLVVVSIVGTIYLVSSDTPAPSPAQIVATAPEQTAAVAPIVEESSPVIALPVVKTVESPAPEIIASIPEPTPVTPALPALPSESSYAYVDQLQIMGVRSSGTDSKVLMNDRVYRINDIVNRTLGLKLTNVSVDTLTFVDPAGASYEKKF